MAKGKVKWFNSSKGYGFIEPAEGGNDIFIHVSQLNEAGIRSVVEEQEIEFELIDGIDGRQMAGDIKVA